MKPDQQSPEWLPISEAIRVLGKSERMEQTLAARGLIAVRVVEEEGKRAQRHYRRADLEKLKAKSSHLPGVIQKSSSERRFVFQVREGAITVSLPGELGEESAEILRSFLDLVIRQSRTLARRSV